MSNKLENVPMKYRIVEKEYEDGHKEYLAQEAVMLFGHPIFWRKHVYETTSDFYGETVNLYCYGDTYEECLDRLKKSLDKEEEKRKKNMVKSITYINVEI